MKLLIESWRKFISEAQEVSWNSFPKIGWWLDNDPITFYHGTHIRNLDFIQKNGIVAPSEGHTANAVSLALEPNTGYGYASMAGAGGEQQFRKVGSIPTTTLPKDRITLVLQIPKSIILSNALPERGAMQSTKGKLTDKVLYEKWVKENGIDNDQGYYALTEIRLPSPVNPEYIKGWMFKSK